MHALVFLLAIACPSLPEGTDWWSEEIAPACGSYPFRVALALVDDAPNICDGPCPRACRITRDGFASVVTYDANARWIRSEPLLNGYAGSSESCSYDDAGHRDSCTKQLTPTLRSTPTVKRDRAGHVVSITDEDTTTFTYDRRGRLSGAATPMLRWTYRYDARGRLVSEVLHSPASTVKKTVTTYRYNRAGQLVERKDPNARTTFEYADNRLVKETSVVGLRRLGGPDTHVATFTYDAQGRPLTAGGFTFEYCDPPR